MPALIHDRPSITAVLTAAGFDLPRAGKNYITVRDPETEERSRLKGDLFREDWTRENILSERLKDRLARPAVPKPARLHRPRRASWPIGAKL
ncbi:hypothetical protein [Rhizobium sp. SL42]|uniref:hypothetical protein n=1 Tax=Rhizobium sp. SL42 TaxID=2806346 RepID=UPI001F1F7E0B|nr:hypothetical protein [Rhizobium sp. SL42]